MLSSKMVLEEKQGGTRSGVISCSFYLSIYLTAPREREGRDKKNGKEKNKERSRRNGMRVGGVVARHESPSGRDAARPKCPQGRTADSCRTQKGHTGVRLTATYTTRATRLVRDARAALCYIYKVFRNYRECRCLGRSREEKRLPFQCRVCKVT